MKSEIELVEQSPLLALQRATHATLRTLTTELVDLDLTAAEINVLANLADGRSRTISQLGLLTGSRPTTMTSVLDRLERRGHVTRGRRAGDRRAVLIELTPTGRAAADTIHQTLTDLESRALSDVARVEVAHFHRVLHVLAEASS